MSTAASIRKPVHEMTAAELLEEARRREANRAAGRPLTAIATTAPDSPEEGALEKRHQEQGRKIVLALGGRWYNLSQPRATKQTPGLPDAMITFARLGLWCWWEVKSATGKQRPDQREFQVDVEGCGQAYVLGPFDALVAWLLASGHFERDGELLVPRR